MSNSLIQGFEHTHVVLREVRTDDRSAPVVLEITPLHRNPRPAVMAELRGRAESKDLGLRKTPNKSRKDRSAPKIQSGVQVDSSGRKRKDLLSDVKSVAARNLANRQIPTVGQALSSAHRRHVRGSTLGAAPLPR